jgi:hypothetical protein
MRLVQVIRQQALPNNPTGAGVANVKVSGTPARRFVPTVAATITHKAETTHSPLMYLLGQTNRIIENGATNAKFCPLSETAPDHVRQAAFTTTLVAATTVLIIVHPQDRRTGNGATNARDLLLLKAPVLEIVKKEACTTTAVAVTITCPSTGIRP